MFKRKRMAVFAVCLGILAVLMGCQKIPPEPTTVPPTTVTTPTQPPLSPKEKYDLAKQQLENASNWILEYTLEESRTVGENTYTKTVSGKASFSKLYSPDMMAVVEEQLSYGDYSSAYMEVYCEGTAYSQVNQSHFKSDMEPENFVERQLPAALLSSKRYQSIQETPGENGTVITFEDAKTLEDWAAKTGAKLVSASGTAVLDSSSTLRETASNITYLLGDTQYSVTASMRVTAPAGLDLSGTHQEHIKGSVLIQDLDAPKLLLQIVGDVYASDVLHCDAVESIYSQAIPLAYSQNTLIDLSGREEKLSASVDYTSHLSDYRGNISTNSQTDAFADGVFTTVKNGGTPQESTTVTAQQMRSYCEDRILAALAAPKYWKNAVITVKKDSIRIDIEGNFAYVSDMMDNVSQFLQVDLESKATTKETKSAGGYIELDRETGLPTAMGLNLERHHTIDTIPYQLTYRLEQNMNLLET